MKVICCSVRLKSLTPISKNCYLAEDWQGNKDLIPSSQVYGTDYQVSSSDAYWISEWILSKKKIVYSKKKCAYFETRFSKPKKIKKEYDKTIIEKYIPKKINKEVVIDKDLLR